MFSAVHLVRGVVGVASPRGALQRLVPARRDDLGPFGVSGLDDAPLVAPVPGKQRKGRSHRGLWSWKVRRRSSRRLSLNRLRVLYESLIAEIGKRRRGRLVPLFLTLPRTRAMEAREDEAFNGVAFVDVHREMAAMSENAVRYEALMQMASGRLRGLQSVVHDGRRG